MLSSLDAICRGCQLGQAQTLLTSGKPPPARRRSVGLNERVEASVSRSARQMASLPLFLTLTLQSCEEASPVRGPTFEQVVTLLDDAAEELHRGVFMNSAGNQQVCKLRCTWAAQCRKK